jgi:Sec-independent protein translocase protein TatA
MGPQELLVILVLALMLFSPRELPKVMKSFARFWGSIRRTAEEFRSAVLDDEELREPIEDIRDAYEGARKGLRGAEEKARHELAKARVEMRRAERALEEVSRDTEQEAARMNDRVATTDDGPTENAQPSSETDEGSATEVQRTGDSANKGAA